MWKKINIVAVFVLGLTGSLWSQSSATAGVYQLGLEVFEKQITEYYTKYALGDGAFRVLYIQESAFVRTIPDAINGRPVQVLTDKNYKRYYRKNGWKLIQLEIRKATLTEGRMEITFVPYHGTYYKEDGVRLELSDWTTVYFKWNSERDIWEVDSVENMGM